MHWLPQSKPVRREEEALGDAVEDARSLPASERSPGRLPELLDVEIDYFLFRAKGGHRSDVAHSLSS